MYGAFEVKHLFHGILHFLHPSFLGARPQRIPPSGTVRAKTFAQLKQAGLGPIGNALVELEGQFPFNLAGATGSNTGNGVDGASPLFGMAKARWSDGFVCPHCQAAGEPFRFANRPGVLRSDSQII